MSSSKIEVISKEVKYASLLNQLKTIVENLLGCHPSKSWDIYGGLKRLHVTMVEILEHEFRFLKDNGKPDLWVFVQGLSWLQPTLAASPSFFGHAMSSIRSPVRNGDKAIAWLCNSIDNYSLSEKLSWLLSDHEHLLSCYNATAFLRQQPYSESTLICLRALEKRQVSLLAKIDTGLYSDHKITTRVHRRCSSYPEAETLDVKTWSVKTATSPHKDKEDMGGTQMVSNIFQNNLTQRKIRKFHDRMINCVFKSTAKEKRAKDFIKQRFLKRWLSCEDLYLLKRNEKRSLIRRPSWISYRFGSSKASDNEKNSSITNRQNCTESSIKEEESPPSFDGLTKTATCLDPNPDNETIATETNTCYQNCNTRKRTNFFKLPFKIWKENDEVENDSSEDFQTTVRTDATADAGAKKSFIENSGHMSLPLSTGSFPKPSPGQSIMSFLTSGVFSQMYAELDRENAHFNISEAIIAALEQVKFNEQIRHDDEIMEESDEEINNLKRIIRIKRREKQKREGAVIDQTVLNENTDSTNTMTTDQSVNSLSSSMYSSSDSLSTDHDEDKKIEDEKNLVSTSNSGVSVSKMSIFSEEVNDSGCKSDFSVSAENVAISLLRKYKEDQLPAASEIEWLVSEQDAPQEILPMPNSIEIDHSSNEDEKRSLLRGTKEWAPPRPQIIFTPHPPQSRKALLEKQNYRCAGCGTPVAPKYASKLRYCDYLGRYFCAGCHSEQVTVIPGRILSKWDFNKYPVSNFSYQLLDQMATDPLFNVLDLNSSLYGQVRVLQRVRILRTVLFYLKDFIFSCKYTDKLKDMIRSESQHVYTDPNCYSMADFIRVKNGTFLKTLTAIAKCCEDHVYQCQLCQGRGFICEICKKQETIYPWQLRSVLRCQKCGSCYHNKCFQQKKLKICPKCSRIDSRNNPNPSVVILGSNF